MRPWYKWTGIFPYSLFAESNNLRCFIHVVCISKAFVGKAYCTIFCWLISFQSYCWPQTKTELKLQLLFWRSFMPYEQYGQLWQKMQLKFWYVFVFRSIASFERCGLCGSIVSSHASIKILAFKARQFWALCLISKLVSSYTIKWQPYGESFTEDCADFESIGYI